MTEPAPQAQHGSVVDRAAEALRVLSLENPDGTFLGSEHEMIAQLDVSRATLRQAASRVAQENFVAVRRGESFFIPRGDTRLAAGDKAVVMGTPEAIAASR